MNWTFFICCLLGLFFAIEARCLPNTGSMWQQQAPDDGVTSCNAPSLLHSVATSSATAGAAPKTATAAIEKGAPAVAIAAPPSMTLTNYVYQYASRPDSMESTCSQKPQELGPESSYPEWECKQELKQLEPPKPEVPKRWTVTLTASEM